MTTKLPIEMTYFCGTDYSTACGSMPMSFIQMLAACLVSIDCDDDHQDQKRLNLLPQFGYCDNLVSFWTCDNNGIDPERAIVENAFALDECGNLGLKVYVNYGAGLQ